MQRFNTFNMIHKALRAMLYDTALTMQQTYFADTDEAAIALEKMNQVIHAFEQHGMHEDTILMPVISKYDQSMIASFEDEHKEDVSLGNKLMHLHKIYNATVSPEERILAGSVITRAFREYMVFNLEHMQREEVELNQLLWEHYSDEELLEINARIVATIDPAEMAATAPWFFRGINKDEAIKWLISVKENAPEFAFESLFELTKTNVPSRFREEVRNTVLAHKVPVPVF